MNQTVRSALGVLLLSAVQASAQETETPKEPVAIPDPLDPSRGCRWNPTITLSDGVG